MAVLHGTVEDREAGVSEFHPEAVRDRQPALWRCLVDRAARSEEEDGSGKSAMQAQEVDPEILNLLGDRGAVSFLALDLVSSDLPGRSFSLFPTHAVVAAVEDRLFHALYRRVVTEYLPVLILTAACEEIQAQFLKQYSKEQPDSKPRASSSLGRRSGGGGRGTVDREGAAAGGDATGSWSDRPKEYYFRSPSSYLTAPAPASLKGGDPREGHTEEPAFPSFTASQLTNRIKQGCQLIWRHYCDHYYRPPPPPPPLPSSGAAAAATPAATATAAKAAAEQRRSSSRISSKQSQILAVEAASQSQAVESSGAGATRTSDANEAVSVVEPTAFWKVVPGGKVALCLHDRLIRKQKEEQLEREREAFSPKPEPPQSSLAGGEGPETTDSVGSSEAAQTNTERAAEGDPAAPEREPKTPPRLAGDGKPNGRDTGKAKPAENGAPRPGDVEDYDFAGDNIPLSAGSSPEKGDKEDGDDDDDDDFVPVEEDDDDEAEASTGDPKEAYVKENVKELVSEANLLMTETKELVEEGNDNASEAMEVDSDADEENVDLVVDNPYLPVTSPAVLEWLGRKTAKHLSVSDLQEIIPSLLFKSKKKAKKPKGIAVGDLLTELDQLVWHRTDESILLCPTSRVALRLTTEHEDESVETWETSYFARTPLTVRLLNDPRALPRDVDQTNTLLAQYKEQRAWDTWRFKSIHGGYAIWPSWMEAVRKHTKVAGTPSDQAANMHGEGGGEPTNESHADSATNGDFALSQSLSQQDLTSEVNSRRTTRRGGDPSGVFYGNQANMTQKQLMDTLCRLISEKTVQTAASLVAAVPDESSDPLRRIRVALGKLIWKRNQVAIVTVQTEWTDDALMSEIRRAPLQSAVDRNDTSQGVRGLIRYIQSLHETELHLRRMVLKGLTSLPVALVATAADERPGSMEAMDSTYFEDVSSISWENSGHSLIGNMVYRPLELSNTDERSACRWFRIVSFCESLAATIDPDDATSQERPSIGLAREPAAVERRKRFQAARVRSPDDIAPDSGHEAERIILTEAQVNAGMKAATLELKRTSKLSRRSNPFSDGLNRQIALFPLGNSGVEQFHGTVVGHDTLREDNGALHPRILVLPQNESLRTGPTWVRLDIQPDSSIRCTIEGDETLYTIQQFDYHSSSPAFKECRTIVQFLQRHPRAGPFLSPVDPIALGIPQYPDIVKNPMDISTLSKKLETGQYSNIGPGQTTGVSPIARMLNGPFRRDVERIFDNAMMFNPPDDWIHLAAAQLKKAVLRKIEQAAALADQASRSRSLAQKSMYVDEDSDIDMYEYDSDPDESYSGSSRRKRKRPASSHTPLKEDSSARVVERPLRLHKLLSETTGQHGFIGDLSINREAKTFSLPPGWTCQQKLVPSDYKDDEDDEDKELDELLSLQKLVEESDSSGLRRSTRSHEAHEVPNGDPRVATTEFEFVPELPSLPIPIATFPTNRYQLELLREQLHEEHFATLWREHYKLLETTAVAEGGKEVGLFSDGSFPPFLGRVVPFIGMDHDHVWEIREPFIAVALRWVIRGLIHSEHLSESEPLSSDSVNSGSILLNNVYTISDGDPFEEIDLKVLVRRKRADQEAESSEEEVEMSEYEKLRAARVARNEERLRELGLA
jgi:hypothetical protein